MAVLKVKGQYSIRAISNILDEDIVRLKRWNPDFDNIIASIEESRNVSFHRFLFALGIRHVGEQTAKDIAKHFQTISRLQNATHEELSHVEGVGEKVAESIRLYFSNDKSLRDIARLLQHVTIEHEEVRTDGKLFNKTFVITGTLPTLSRDDAKTLIEDNGGKVAGSVSSRTSYLLLGENPGSKYEDALQYGVPCISEEDFKNML
jgi:DNA ligase (NAD+)